MLFWIAKFSYTTIRKRIVFNTDADHADSCNWLKCKNIWVELPLNAHVAMGLHLHLTSLFDCLKCLTFSTNLCFFSIISLSSIAHQWCTAEMSRLWNFSVQVQFWSDVIESDPALISEIFENHMSNPVLIRQHKIMYFYFASWDKRTTGAILPLAKYDWLEAK